MTWTFRTIALSLIVAVFMAGPLAPVARAQQQPLGFFQESTKASPSDTGPIDPYPPAYDAGAVVADVFYVPGKVILCAAGVAVSIGVLAVTFGTAYKAAAGFSREGCGGKWVLTGRDLRPSEPGPETFYWEQSTSR